MNINKLNSIAASPVFLLTGATGQIGHELARELAALGDVVAPSRAVLDLLDRDSIVAAIEQARPSVVVNAAAYTLVDAAESDRERCHRINAVAPGDIAEMCRKLGALMIHFSTDYVFDGSKMTPYLEDDAPAPLGWYGRTKLEGERAVESSGAAYLIFRTSWVYSARGHNFVRTMLRLARERETLAVVDDQTGAPTSAAAVATGVREVLERLLGAPDLVAAARDASGIYHMTAGGSTTWFDFARRVLADDPYASEQVCRAVRPIKTAEYPTAARRPAYSILDNGKIAARFGVRLPSWMDQWQSTLPALTRA